VARQLRGSGPPGKPEELRTVQKPPILYGKSKPQADEPPAATNHEQMPWTPDDAERHTHKATTTALKELWAKIANERLERTGDEARAIREANAVVAARHAEGRWS
jgi:hypothetical protein